MKKIKNINPITLYKIEIVETKIRHNINYLEELFILTTSTSDVELGNKLSLKEIMKPFTNYYRCVCKLIDNNAELVEFIKKTDNYVEPGT